MIALPESVRTGAIEPHWHLGIAGRSGYKQTPLKPAGMQATMRRLDEKYELYPRITVWDCEEWRYSPKKQAMSMVRQGVTHAILIGYSWGFGYGVRKLAYELVKRGVRVELLLDCDGVMRNGKLPTFWPCNYLSGRSLMPWAGSIVLPESCDNVQGYRQENDKPAGFPYRVGKKGDKTELPVLRSEIHTSIDECQPWNKLVDQKVHHIAKPFMALT